MNKSGIRAGDEVTIVIYVNKASVGEVIINAISEDEVAAGVYTDDGDTLLTMHEALKAAAGCVDYHLAKPSLKKMMDQRIAELRDMIAGEEGEPPSPANGIEGIPF
jgi:hypothetical protein